MPGSVANQLRMKMSFKFYCIPLTHTFQASAYKAISKELYDEEIFLASASRRKKIFVYGLIISNINFISINFISYDISFFSLKTRFSTL